MSRQVFETDGLIVSAHVGPANEGADRQRWQFTPMSGDVAVLNRRQVRALIVVLLRDAWRVSKPREDA